MPASTKKVPPALLDAIAKPKAPPGTVQREKVRDLRIHPERRNGPVRTVQPGIEGWSCDECDRTGAGGEALLAHFGESGHMFYEPAEVTS